MSNSTDRFVSGLLTTGAGYSFTIVFGFLGLAIAARQITTEQFGVYILLEIVASLFVVFSDLGIGLSTTQHIAATADTVAIQFLVNTVISCRLLICIVLGLLTFLCKPIILTIFKAPLLAELTLFISILGSLTSLDMLFAYILRGFQSYKNIAIAQILASGLKASLIVVFLVILKLDLMGLVYASIISVSVSVLWQYSVIPDKRKWSISFPALKKLMTFGFPLGMNSLLTFAFQKTDALIIGTLLNPIQVAYYGVASKIPDSLLRFFQFFEIVYLPSVSESHSKGERGQTTALLNNSLRLISFASTTAVLITLLFQ
jgi:teichuronic acid exporter